MVAPLLLPVLAVLAAILGSCVGSFLNVVTWRLPREESVVLPSSHCPRCGTTLNWFENIPVLSWLLLMGRCRHCKTGISPRYPLVELLTAGLWVAAVVAQPSGMGAEAPPLQLLFAGWLLLSWLIPLTLIDLDRLWLPESLCRIGLFLGLVCTMVLGFQQGVPIGRELLLHHLLAAALGLLGFEAVSGLAEKAMGRPALGLGDAKLAAMLGAWLGLTGLGLTVMLAVVGGAVVGVVGRVSGRLGRFDPLPFGPFLTTAAAAVWLLGNAFWLRLL